MEDSKTNITETLMAEVREPAAKVAEKLLPMVYDELRDLAANLLRSERANHTLQPTALVHEAYMKLVDQSRVDWKGKTHFYAVSASAMRRILIDHARTKGRDKRGGQWQRVVLDDVDVADGQNVVDAVALDAALESLQAVDPDQARIVELRFFGGLTVEEVAEVVGVSKRKIEGDWTHAKAWLRSALDPGTDS